MKILILIFGICSLSLGVAQPADFVPKTVELRIHQVYHEKCSSDGCVIVDREF